MRSNDTTPLRGIRVLDFGSAWAGPHAAEALAWLGADVVKVESRRRLDLMRVGAPETSLAFNEINLCKRSLALDLQHPQATDVIHRLVRVADVMLDNWRPGVMERLGLGYEVVSALNPRIVMASVSAFGSSGEESGYAGYASVFCALGGLAELTGYPDWEPALVRSPMDLTVANATATLTIAALFEREISGRGRFLDVSAVEVISTLIPLALTEVQRGRDQRLLTRRGNDGLATFQGCYPCKGPDSWIAITLDDDRAVRAFSDLLNTDPSNLRRADGSASYVATVDPQANVYTGLDGLLSAREHAHTVIASWSADQDAWELVQILQAHGIAAHPTSNPASEASEEHLWLRGALTSVRHEVQGELTVLQAPWRLKAGGHSLGRPSLRAAPIFGAHTREVLDEWAGMETDEYEALAAASVFT